MRYFYHFCLFQVVRLSLTEEGIQRGSKKREVDELKRSCMHDKGVTVIEM